jgi:hypothetical protein
MTSVDPKLLERVRKLLAKAEHPATPAPEAEAFSAKAAALMADYAINQALLEAGSSDRAKPVVRQLTVEPPYALPRAVLLDRVARAHRVRVVVGPETDGGRLCTLVGFPIDLGLVEVMFTSLLLQASTAMRHASETSTRPRAFRRAFLLGYADTIGARLAAVRDDADTGAQRAHPGAELVLADRGRQVEEAFDRQFPRLRSMRMSTSSGGGLVAGRAAGARADLSSAASRVGGERRRALG